METPYVRGWSAAGALAVLAACGPAPALDSSNAGIEAELRFEADVPHAGADALAAEMEAIPAVGLEADAPASFGLERGPALLEGSETPVGEEVEAIRSVLEPVPDQYIVVFRDDRAPDVDALVKRLADAHDVEVLFAYHTALRGFAGRMTRGAAEAIARDPAVRFVEEDGVVEANSTTQTGATWGLDRIDAPTGLDNSYTYDFDGTGVHAYIIDTGIRASHNEFSGRIGAGYDSVDGDTDPSDCDGHGTHVAGTVGGTVYGVAKNVTLHGVRVLNCSGSGTISGVVAGVDWVAANAISPAVGNMSLGGGASSSLDSAVNNAVSAGVVMVVAAGNSNADACNQSPARAASAITVGSTTNTDARSSFSNYGSCVDIFAPGSSITSAWYTSNSAINTISGTSMASPHVAGIVALYLDDNPGSSPSATASAVIGNATSGVVSNPGPGSPNLLAYSLFGGGSPPPPPPPPPSSPCTDPACEAYSGSLSGTGDWDAQPNGTYYYSSSGTHQGYLEGPTSADFDLRLYRWSWGGWRTVASSLSSSSSESITYSGSSGYYYWRITSYSGSGPYDFWMVRP